MEATYSDVHRVFYVFVFSCLHMAGAETPNTHLRQWTSWYNTDNPTIGAGDDESVHSIRKRGLEVCDGNAPIDSVCRLADHHAIVFNADTVSFTDNIFANACTTSGLVCINEEQDRNVSCRDYEIRFECLSPLTEEDPENLGVVAVAAGMSIILPIMCVIVMHMIRIIKERRTRRNQRSGNNDQSMQTDNSADLPPSYSELFGESSSSTDRLLSDTPNSAPLISVLSGSDDTRLNVMSEINSPSVNDRTNNVPDDVLDGGVYSITDNRGLYSSRSGSLSIQSPSAHAQVECFQNSRQNRFNFPGMHLSIHELLVSSESHMNTLESPLQSPTMSYIQTPPPSYSDAITILGVLPLKHGATTTEADTTATDPKCSLDSAIATEK